MASFQRIKEALDFRELLQRELPGSKIFKTGKVLRCNPCPLCHHNDCFSFSSDHFHCFSCGQRGDVVDFVSRTKNLTSIEAFRYVANIIGISPEAHQKVAPSEKNVSRHDEKKSISLSDEKRVELQRLRKIAADFYHRKLFENKSALAYQTQERGHSVEVLERACVGYTASGGLVQHVLKLGLDPASLVETGLVRIVEGRLREYIPRGCYIYPHFAGEAVYYFSFKDVEKRYRFQIPKRRELPGGTTIPYHDPAWVCYGQDGLHHDGCWIVEGENDRLAILDAGEPYVAATLGGFAQPEVTGWLRQHAAGKTFFLCFDDDEAGRKYVRHYCEIIIGAEGEAKVVKL